MCRHRAYVARQVLGTSTLDASNEQAEFPILVVGGRTTGLTMACELARHGAPVRIIDKSPGIDPHCRATVLLALGTRFYSTTAESGSALSLRFFQLRCLHS